MSSGGWACTFGARRAGGRNFVIGLLRLPTARVDVVSRRNRQAQKGDEIRTFPHLAPLIQGGSDSANQPGVRSLLLRTEHQIWTARSMQLQTRSFAYRRPLNLFLNSDELPFSISAKAAPTDLSGDARLQQCSSASHAPASYRPRRFLASRTERAPVFGPVVAHLCLRDPT